MITIDPEVFDRYCELVDEYKEKYKNLNLPEFLLFPKEFYDIDDYGIRGEILKNALNNDIRVEQTEIIQQNHEAALDMKLRENIDIATERRMK